MIRVNFTLTHFTSGVLFTRSKSNVLYYKENYSQ